MTHKIRRTTSRPAPRRRAPFMPAALEGLEPRWLLAVFNIVPGAGDAGLRAALAAAAGNSDAVNVINLAAGMYDLSNASAGALLVDNALGTSGLQKTLIIAGAGEGASVIEPAASLSSPSVNGAWESRVFTIDGADMTVVIEGLTIAGGNEQASGNQAAAEGGGLLVDGGRVTLSNVAVRGNVVQGGVGSSGVVVGTVAPMGVVSRGGNARGGGIYLAAGSLTLNDVTVAGNTAIGGSGQYGGNATGGAIYAAVGQLKLIGGEIEGNVAQGGAGERRSDGGKGESGGIYVATGSLSIRGTARSRNTAVHGGRLHGSKDGGAAMDTTGPGTSPAGTTPTYPRTTITTGPTPTIPIITGGGGSGTGGPTGPQLKFVHEPPSLVTAGATISTVKVDAEDADGQLLDQDSSSSVTLSIYTGPTGATLAGTATVRLDDGVATFNNLALTKAGDYRLTASDPSFSDDISDPFTVAPAAPAALDFTAQPVGATAGTAMPPVVVALQDQYGNVETGDNSSVTIAIASAPAGGGFLANSVTSVAAVSGVATFNNLYFNTVGTYSLKATDSGPPALTSAASHTFMNSLGPASQLVFSAPPPTTAAGATLSPAVTVSVEDAGGNLLATDATSITLALNTGPTGGLLHGAATATAIDGVATFRNLSFTAAGFYTLAASDATHGLSGLPSGDFTVTGPATGATLSVTGRGEDIPSGATSISPANDTSFGNIFVPVAGAPVSHTFTITDSGTATLNLTGPLVALSGADPGDFSITQMPAATLAPGASTSFTIAFNPVQLGTSSATVQIASSDPAHRQYTFVVSGTATTDLFDSAYYLAANPDVAAAVKAGVFTSAYQQFVEFGQFEGRQPNAYFNESFYLAHNPDVAAAVKSGDFTSGFEHFVFFGQKEDRLFNPFFSESFYLSQNPDVASAVAAGSFTSGFEHFLLFGQYEDRAFSPDFDEQTYLALNPDVAAAVAAGDFESGFEHFEIDGIKEDRPFTALFDAAFYLEQNPDVAAAVKAGDFASAYQHFIEYGIHEGRNYSPYFWEPFYLAANPDVAAAVKAGEFSSGLEHYVLDGQFERREPVPATAGGDQAAVGVLRISPTPLNHASAMTFTAGDVSYASTGAPAIASVEFWIAAAPATALDTTNDTLLGTGIEQIDGNWALSLASLSTFTAGSYVLFARAKGADGAWGPGTPLDVTLT